MKKYVHKDLAPIATDATDATPWRGGNRAFLLLAQRTEPNRTRYPTPPRPTPPRSSPPRRAKSGEIALCGEPQLNISDVMLSKFLRGKVFALCSKRVPHHEIGGVRGVAELRGGTPGAPIPAPARSGGRVRGERCLKPFYDPDILATYPKTSAIPFNFSTLRTNYPSPLW